MLKILSLFLGLSMSLTAYASSDQTSTMYHNFADCNGVIDGANFRLQFFEKVVLGDKDTPTGEGIMVQTLTAPENNDLGPDEPKDLTTLSVLRIKQIKGARQVEIAPVFTSNEIFAAVTIPDNQKFPLQIFAIQFGKVWGNFQCTSQN